MEVLTELESLGYEITLNGDSIKLKYAKSGDPPKEKVLPLLEDLKKRKTEAMELLNAKTVIDFSRVNSIEEMPLSEFAKNNLALKVNSSILGEIVYFASNDAVAKKLKGEGFITYTAKELEYLAKKGLTPEELIKMHTVKTIFPGSKIVN